MRYSYVFCILAGLGLAGCETAPEINSSVTGDGTAVDRTTGDRTAGDRTAGDRTAGDRTAGDRTAGDRTVGERPVSERPVSDLTASDRTARDGTSRDRTARDGTSRDGTAGDGTSRDGTSRDGTSSRSAPAAGTGRLVTGAVTSQTAPALGPGSTQDFVERGDRVLFGLDRFDLSPEARIIIENQAAWLERFPIYSVTIEGHADERGTREYNLALGERRANSVRDYMIALGIDPNRVRTISYGKERPYNPMSNEEAWKQNRRGVTVLDKGAG